MCHTWSVNIALLALQHTFRFFRKKKHFKVKENLQTINRKTEFPDFSLTLTISKIFPDLEKFSVFPDRGNPVHVSALSCNLSLIFQLNPLIGP